MNDVKHSEEQTHSPETLTELSPQELLQRIHAAETAIFSRLQGMRISSIDLVEGRQSKMPWTVWCVSRKKHWNSLIR
jgi:hypothetical protein